MPFLSTFPLLPWENVYRVRPLKKKSCYSLPQVKAPLWPSQTALALGSYCDGLKILTLRVNWKKSGDWKAININKIKHFINPPQTSPFQPLPRKTVQHALKNNKNKYCNAMCAVHFSADVQGLQQHTKHRKQMCRAYNSIQSIENRCAGLTTAYKA